MTPSNCMSLSAAKKAPKLSNTKYAVLGLGDSSYEFFCQTGKDFDERLGKLGAKALVERADLDVDYEAQAEAWISKLIEALKRILLPLLQRLLPPRLALPFKELQHKHTRKKRLTQLRFLIRRK